MQKGFDVEEAREMYLRQKADAEKIVILCDALVKMNEENQALKSELAKCKPKEETKPETAAN